MESYLPAIPSEAPPTSAHSHSEAPRRSSFAPEQGLLFYTKGTNTYYGTPHTLLRAQFPAQETFSGISATSTLTGHEHELGEFEPRNTFIPRHEGSEFSIEFKDDSDNHSVVISKAGSLKVHGDDTVHSESHSHSPVDIAVSALPKCLLSRINSNKMLDLSMYLTRPLESLDGEV
ncbi:hypothetical protein V866_005486 [Kwoniella sp. B9012]